MTRVIALCLLSLALYGCAGLLLAAPLAAAGIGNATYRVVTGRWPKSAYEQHCLPAPKTDEMRDWCERAKPSGSP